MQSGRKCSTPIPVHWKKVEFIEDKVRAEDRACIEISERRAQGVGDGQETAQCLVNGRKKQIGLETRIFRSFAGLKGNTLQSL